MMASEHNIDNEDEEQFTQVFGEHTGIASSCLARIDEIKNNDPNVEKLQIRSFDRFPDTLIAWELIGRYIANNDCLLEIDLSGIDLTDEQMAILFNSLVKSRSLIMVILNDNEIGMNGIRSMVPFLKNSPNLHRINLGFNNNINTEGFEVLINALDGGPIEGLYLDSCNIKDISVLGNCTLPHLHELHLERNSLRNMGNISSLEQYTNLKQLHLEDNNIGREGCIVIGNLLEKEGSSLHYLDLDQNNIDDEGAEILAASLKHNNSLTSLYLKGNNINEKGCLAFLKLLNDVSSIDSTYNSNHTVVEIMVPKFEPDNRNEISRHLQSATTMNEESFNAGRTKVIICQLNSDRRMEQCRIQGVPYSYSSIFSDIDALVLPEVLSLVGQTHGQTELYRMLIAVVPDLASTVNREVVVRQQLAEKSAQMEALRAEIVELNNELMLIAEKKNDQSTNSSDSKKCGKKRGRSADP